MDPPLVNDSSFSAANPSSYTLSEIWPFPVNDTVRSGLRLAVNSGQVFNRSGLAEHSGNKDVSVAEESTVTDLTAGWGRRKTRDLNSEDESSKMVSSSSSGNELKESGDKKRKICGSESGNGDGSVRPEGETSSGGGSKATEQKDKPEPPKDYIHVRARRGQATDRHSLAERARREKISEKMTALQDIIPGCNKIIGKALLLPSLEVTSIDPTLIRALMEHLYANAVWAAIESPEDSGNFTDSQIPFKCSEDSPIKCTPAPGAGSGPALGYVYSFGQDNNKDIHLLTSSGVYRIVRPSRCSLACSKENTTASKGKQSPAGTAPSPQPLPSSARKLCFSLFMSLLFLFSTCLTVLE